MKQAGLFSIFLLMVLTISKATPTIQGDNNSIEHEFFVYDEFGNKTFDFSTSLTGSYHMLLNLNTNDELLFQSPEYFYLFIDNNLSGKYKKFIMREDSLRVPFANPKTRVTIKTEDFESINAILNFSEKSKSDLQILPRVITSDSAKVIFLIIVTLLTIARVSYSGLKGNFFQFNRIFELRDTEEVVLWSKQFSGHANYHIFLLASILGYIILFFYYGFNDLTTDLINWFLLTTAAYLFIHLRVFYIKFFGYLFNLKNNAQFQSINFIRLSLILSTLLAIYIFSASLIEDNRFTTAEYVGNITIILLLIRVFILSLKLINGTNRKIVIKISYLCGTEVVPLLGIIFLAFQFL